MVRSTPAKFSEFQPKLPASAPALDRLTFAGLSPEEAADRVVAFHASRTPMRPVTQEHRKVIYRRVLRDLQTKGLDLATVTSSEMQVYREYLRHLVEQKALTENYAASIVSKWNAAMRACFAEKGRPGEGLLMRGFRERPRVVEHLTEEEMASLLSAARLRRFKSEHHREAFVTYLEVSFCAGARLGSLLDHKARVGDIDWDNMTLHLRHMKNVQAHDVVLSPRAAERLRKWVDHLRTLTIWQGADTPLFIGPDGVALTHHFVNPALKSTAALAGIRKKVTSHVLRKSVGTLIANQNPKMAMQQLGISQRVFERHYNLPLLKDRLERRDLLPGPRWNPRTPEQLLAAAHADLIAGRIGKAQYDAILAQAEAQKRLPSPRTPEPSYFA